MFKNNITFIFGAYSLYNKYLTWSDPNVHHLTIGDEGPAGGVVFYIEEDGVTGLEAAPHDMDLVDDEGQWGCWGTNVPGAIRTEIGAGKANTTAIALNCPAARNAAVICVNYHYLEFQDWFLPSLKELREMYKNRDKVGTSNTSYYWSSTQYTEWAAYTIDFLNGNVETKSKINPQEVRAVRRF